MARDGKAGYVYILTNKAMPGLVKIGMTRRTPKIRARELYNTSVPYPFEVYHAIRVADCEEAERAMHESLRRLRASHSREFFVVEPELAAQLLEKSVRSFKARGHGYLGLLLISLLGAVIVGAGYWLWREGGTADRTDVITILIAAAVILGLFGSSRASKRHKRRTRR